MKLVPSAPPKTASVDATLNQEYGVHDSLRYGIRNIKTEIQGHHPLEAHLEQVSNHLDIFYGIG